MTEIEKVIRLKSIYNNEVFSGPEDNLENDAFPYGSLEKFAEEKGFIDHESILKGKNSYWNNRYNACINRIDNLKEMVGNFNECMLSLNNYTETKGKSDNLYYIQSDSVINIAIESYQSVNFSQDAINHIIQSMLDEWEAYIKINKLDIDITGHLENINKSRKKLEVLDHIYPIYAEFIETFTMVEELCSVNSSLKRSELIDKNYLVNIQKNIENENKTVSEAIEPLRISLKEYIESPDRCFNDPFYKKDLSVIYSESGIIDAFKNINKELSGIYNKITNCDTHKSLTMAEAFIRSERKQSESSVALFLDEKRKQNSISYQLDFEASAKYTNLYFFKDESLVIKDNKGQYILPFNHSETIAPISDIYKIMIDSKLKKFPYIAKIMKKEIEKDPNEIDKCLIAINTYIANEAILKVNKFNIIDNLSNARPDFEYLDDKMNKIINSHHVKQYAHSIVSNKYRHLYDDDTYTIIKEIYDLKIDAHGLQDSIGKKLAAFKTPTDFNEALQKLLNTFTSFTPEQMIKKAADNHVEIIANENNILILKIENFEQSKALGSSSWCISRRKEYFDSYANNNNQYFIYDFSKNSTDIESMIGLTLYPNGIYKASHKKNDNNYTESDAKNIQLYILENDRYGFNEELDHELRIELSKIKPLSSSNKLNYN